MSLNVSLSGWVSGMAVIGFAVTMWLGFYLATHMTGSKSARLATLCIVSLAGYFLHAVLCLHVPAVQAGFLWRRFLGWFVVPPLPLWYHLTLELLPPSLADRQRVLIIPTYLGGGLLIVLWIFAPWTFSTESLVPVQLIWPVGLYGGLISLICLANLWLSQRQTGQAALRRPQQLLGLVTLLVATGGLYWPALAALLNLPLLPTTILALGEMIQVVGVVLLGYTIARHNVFIVGKWVGRDFVYHLVAIAVVAGLYALAIWGAAQVAQRLDFDVLTLTLVLVVGLAICTHLLVDWARGIWDAIFFRQLQPLRVEMRSLAQNLGQLRPFEQRMQHLVEQLVGLISASTICLAIWEDDQLVIRASTERSRLNRVIPRPAMVGSRLSWGAETVTKIHANESMISIPPGCEDLVLGEPIMVFGQEAGILLLGDQGVGEGYSREDRVWVAAIAGQVATQLERLRLQTEATTLLADLAQELDEITVDEPDLPAKPGFKVGLNRQELREAIHCFSQPDKLTEMLALPESSLARLPAIASAGHLAAGTLQKLILDALDLLRPDLLPDLDELRQRRLVAKRRQHLPSTVADYYTLQLIMAGYSHEVVAEQMEVSPRQVRNYLSRAIGRLSAILPELGQLP